MKDYLPIFRRNLSSPIVLAILVLAVALALLHEYRDAWFLSFVITVNTLIAIVQEIRASWALKKLELMSAPLAHKVGQDGIEDVRYDQLAIDDIIELRPGDEVPADCHIIESDGLTVDESILTGESRQIDKDDKSLVFAASQVLSGKATAKVIAVGHSTRVGSMTASLKSYQPSLTPMQYRILQAITWLTYGAVLLALLIIVIYSFSGETAVVIFKTVASAAIAIVPEGLLLASTLLLAFGSLRLAKAKVLPQKMSAIEAMAQLDVLCTDKTGTLTDENIKFDELIYIDKSSKQLPDYIGIVAKETDSGSTTNRAIISEFNAPVGYEVLQRLAFSSKHKMSGAKFRLNDKTVTILIGAPEFMIDIVPYGEKYRQQIASLTSVGKRVLMVGQIDDDSASIKRLTHGIGRPIGLIVLSNELRKDAISTVKYLQNHGISLKVISGDNPETVRYIAMQAGIKRSDRLITGAELEALPDSKWDAMVKNKTVFARVLPEQKERLIETLRRLGYYTGMVGDGVNDALALKKSDLSIAMYAGASASRRIADIVILDNSFSSLPIGMKLGGRIIQSIEMIATLFFHKIIYGIILLIVTMSAGLMYPFDPRHVTFINIFLVTLPTLMWTFFPPSSRYRLKPSNFWRDTLLSILPIAVITGLTVAFIYIVLSKIYPGNPTEISTVTVIVSTFMGIYLVFLVPVIFNIKNSRSSTAAWLFYIMSVLLILVPSFSLRIVRDFFSFTLPNWYQIWPLVFVVIGAVILQWALAFIARLRLIKRNEA